MALMIEGEYTERSHSGQSKVVRHQQSSTQSKARRRTAMAASRAGTSRAAQAAKERRVGCQRA
ncbi:unnamed protein product, partial [Closterium sp. NIES-54]